MDDVAPIEVELTVRGGRGELTLIGSTTNAAPTALQDVVAIVESIQASGELTGLDLHLAADQPLDHEDPLPEAVAERLGLGIRRDLFQMRRTLPVPTDDPVRERVTPVSVRPIDLADGATDREAWVRVNNRAFASHPDQGAETVDTLDDRLDPERTDPSGFLVADDPDRPGELLGFCWTKVHAATDIDPEMGEIYVIGVDPAWTGKGLGTSLVLRGLDQLATRGIEVAMLYVDGDNTSARHMYDRLGFAAHHRRCVYTAEAP